MSQCPFLIKDASDIGYFRCQLEEHPKDVLHELPIDSPGKKNVTEGGWFDPKVAVARVPLVWKELLEKGKFR